MLRITHLGGELLDVLQAPCPGIVLREAMKAADVGVAVVARRLVAARLVRKPAEAHEFLHQMQLMAFHPQ
jgi:hypothetical protein